MVVGDSVQQDGDNSEMELFVECQMSEDEYHLSPYAPDAPPSAPLLEEEGTEETATKERRETTRTEEKKIYVNGEMKFIRGFSHFPSIPSQFPSQLRAENVVSEEEHNDYVRQVIEKLDQEKDQASKLKNFLSDCFGRPLFYVGVLELLLFVGVIISFFMMVVLFHIEGPNSSHAMISLWIGVGCIGAFVVVFLLLAIRTICLRRSCYVRGDNDYVEEGVQAVEEFAETLAETKFGTARGIHYKLSLDRGFIEQLNREYAHWKWVITVRKENEGEIEGKFVS